jgi:hypothetical protein
MLELAMALALSGPVSVGPDVDAIRAGRAASNAAIAGRKWPALRELFVPDAHLIAGNVGSLIVGADAIVVGMSTSAAAPGFLTYVRTPSTIRVSDARDRASERGEWVGNWRKPDGLAKLGGEYQATWVRTAEGWRIKNEVFVTLSCTGSAECASLRPVSEPK